jgi:ABC-type uncharacterized transport system ATPase subunit
MKFLKPVAQYTLVDSQRNTELWRQLSVYNLNQELRKIEEVFALTRFKNDRKYAAEIFLHYKFQNHRHIARLVTMWKGDLFCRLKRTKNLRSMFL